MPSLMETKPGYLFILPWTLESLGGVSQVVENLIYQMEIHGRYIPLLLVNSWTDKEIRKQTIKRRAHYFFRLRSIWNRRRPLKNLFTFLLFLPVSLWAFNKFAREHRVAVINIHYCGLYALNIGILKLLRIFRGKFILSFHGKDVLAAKEAKGPEKMLWRVLLYSADRLVTCSEALKQEVSDIDRRSAWKAVAIHNGIDSAFIANERDGDYRLDQALDGRRFILNIATFEHKKGQDILVNAFATAAKMFHDVDLILIGRAKESLDSLRSQIGHLGLSDRVRLYEGVSHDRLAAFLEKATLFALPSRYEPFGIAILEAGVFGVPVVATGIGGVNEILTHDYTGRLCKSEDVKSLAAELTYLLNHPEERERLGHNLKNHVLQNFSWMQAYEKYIECLKA